MKITYKQGFYDPDQPENRTKEKDQGKEARARKKKTTSSILFILRNLGKVKKKGRKKERKKEKQTPRRFLRAV